MWLRAVRWGDCPWLSGWAEGNQKCPHKKEAKGSERFEDATLLALEVKEGAMSKGMQAASRSSRKQVRRFSFEFPEGMNAASPLPWF